MLAICVPSYLLFFYGFRTLGAASSSKTSSASRSKAIAELVAMGESDESAKYILDCFNVSVSFVESLRMQRLTRTSGECNELDHTGWI